MRTQEEEEREGMRQSEPDRALLREKGLDPFVTMPVHNDNKLKSSVTNSPSLTVRCMFSDKERNSSRSRSLGFIVDHKDGHLRYTG